MEVSIAALSRILIGMSGTITDALICKSTGQYDQEVIQRLRLEGLGSLQFKLLISFIVKVIPI